MCLQILSQVSNTFFNVIDDQIQEKAANTIALCLARLLQPDALSATPQTVSVSATSAAAVLESASG